MKLVETVQDAARADERPLTIHVDFDNKEPSGYKCEISFNGGFAKAFIATSVLLGALVDEAFGIKGEEKTEDEVAEKIVLYSDAISLLAYKNYLDGLKEEEE